jgi:hypothetical protein
MSASQAEIAHEILARIVSICPTFRPYWDDPKNCFRDEEGFFTNGGVFSEFSSFFRECHDQLSEGQLCDLGLLVLECERDFRNEDAVYTMFLENIAGDPPAETLAPYLSPSAIQFLDQCSN